MNRTTSDNQNRMRTSELCKYLQFELVDTTDMTQDQLKEIPYTVVNSQQMNPKKLDIFVNNRGRENMNRIKRYI